MLPTNEFANLNVFYSTFAVQAIWLKSMKSHATHQSCSATSLAKIL